MLTKDKKDCKHERKDFRDFRRKTATTWQWKCRSCGHIARPRSLRAGDTVAGEANQVIGLLQIVVQLQEDLGQQVGLEQMDKIYQRCKGYISILAVKGPLEMKVPSGEAPATATDEVGGDDGSIVLV